MKVDMNLYNEDRNQAINEQSPEQVRSYVEEYLKECNAIEDNVGTYYLIPNSDNYLKRIGTDKFQIFCKELELLLEMRNTVNEYINKIKPSI